MLTLPRPVAFVVIVGVALRGLAMVAAGPIWLFLNDSREYLVTARHPGFAGYHPLGYPLFLRLTATGAHPLALSVVQHVIGVACGVLVAVAALRLGAPGWLAALAAAPQLLDPYVVVLEQMVMAETLMTLLVTAAVVVLVTVRRGLGPVRVTPVVVAGLLIAAAILARTAAIGALAAVVMWIVLVRPRWPVAVAGVAALGLPLAGYASLFAASTGQMGLTAHAQRFLYARMAPYADCSRVGLTGEAARLCDPRPVRDRPQPDYYLWHARSPLKQLPESRRDADAAAAGHAMLRAQPLTWAAVTLRTTGEFLTWGPWVRHVTGKQADPSILVADARRSTIRPLDDPRAASGVRRVGWVRSGPIRVLHTYQRWVASPVPVLAVIALIGLVRPRDPNRRAAIAVAAAAVLGLLVTPAALSEWDVRYLLPTLPLLGLTAALALPGGRPAHARRGVR